MDKALVLALLLLTPIVSAVAAPAPAGLPVPLADARPANLAQGWSTLAPAQQRELRARYEAWKALDEDSRHRIRRAAVAVTQLPASKQQELRAQFENQDQMIRDGWWLGPELGALYPKLQPLFGFVPVEQRPAFLALLRQLDDGDRAQLALISQRTPPQDRDALRSELLAIPASQRAEWLRRNVNR
jgi:hypothetical protein